MAGVRPWASPEDTDVAVCEALLASKLQSGAAVGSGWPRPVTLPPTEQNGAQTISCAGADGYGGSNLFDRGLGGSISGGTGGTDGGVASTAASLLAAAASRVRGAVASIRSLPSAGAQVGLSHLYVWMIPH